MQHIINDDFTVRQKTYELKGIIYEFIGCKSNGFSAKDSIDEVKNLTTKERKDIPRMKLYKYTRLIIVYNVII